MAKLMNKLVDSFEHDEIPDVGCVRAVLAELVLTFLFVFTGVSAAMAAGTSYVHAPTAPLSDRLLSTRPPSYLLFIPLGSGQEKTGPFPPL
jgi:hypothetical protein